MGKLLIKLNGNHLLNNSNKMLDCLIWWIHKVKGALPIKYFKILWMELKRIIKFLNLKLNLTLRKIILKWLNKLLYSNFQTNYKIFHCITMLKLFTNNIFIIILNKKLNRKMQLNNKNRRKNKDKNKQLWKKLKRSKEKQYLKYLNNITKILNLNMIFQNTQIKLNRI